LAYAALSAGIVEPTALVVRQGIAMGRPSEIHLRFDETGCWLGGRVDF
jgi:predicted PhzF superfamily epimerase YddE/YHI9